MLQKTLRFTAIAFLVLCMAFAGQVLALKMPADNSCSSLSQAVIALDHPIAQELNRQYREEGTTKYREDLHRREGFTLNTEWPDPTSRVTSLIKVGDYGLARWGRTQQIVLYFQKNQLGLRRSQLVHNIQAACINCSDEDAAVASVEAILRGSDANIKCLEQLEAENWWRISGKDGESFWR